MPEFDLSKTAVDAAHASETFGKQRQIMQASQMAAISERVIILKRIT